MRTPSAHMVKSMYVWSAIFQMQMDWTQALERQGHITHHIFTVQYVVFEESTKHYFSSSSGWKPKNLHFLSILRRAKKWNEQNRHKTATNLRLEWLNYYAITIKTAAATTTTTATATSTVKRNSRVAAIAYKHAVQPQRTEKAIHFFFA